MHQVIKDTEIRMRKGIEAYKAEIAKVRTGRANPSILEHVRIDYHGTEMPINQVANINVSDSRTLTITPWEKSMVSAIEKAIMNSDLGLNPATTGELIRVPMPALNEERRKELIKVVKTEAENAKISIRNMRRDANASLKDSLKAKTITEDEERRLTDDVQKMTNKFIAEIDQLTEVKEKDLMVV